ncbi:MAG: bifunctional transcriptional activator/DNA repair enzyme AdaA [Thermohalobaculum sp.]
MLDPRTCYDAIIGRDRSVDGVFFVGVRTTMIYCRPVCSARVPRFENMSFHPTAAAAERAGFRPCLRCRPESAPFSPAWKGSLASVERDLRLIEDGALDTGTVADLSDRLGMSVRQLNRLFDKHAGAAPLQIAKTVRVQRAKRLLHTSDLGMEELAARAGFTSSRRMSAAFTALYGRPPSSFRRRTGRAPAPGSQRPISTNEETEHADRPACHPAEQPNA